MLGRKNYAACLVGMVVAALAMSTGGCASSSGGEKLAQSYSRTRSHLATAQGQVDDTLASLKNVRLTDAESTDFCV